MSLDWKTKTCRDCMYRDERWCRKFPPSVLSGAEKIVPDFILVQEDDAVGSLRYSAACSFYEKNSELGE